jgi:hypothetical protein
MKTPPRLLLAFLAPVLTILALVALGGAGAGASSAPVADGKGAFHVNCAFSHRRNDDPIVFPRGPGASHSHDFFGSRSTDAFARPDSLRVSATNCVRTDTPARNTDRSAYWVPTLYTGTRAVAPSTVDAYYKTGHRGMRIQPFPPQLRIIAGDAKGRTPSLVNGQHVFAFFCQGGTRTPGTDTRAPLCRTRRLDLVIRFPDCWDGRQTDSRDHKSHMAYSSPTGRRPSERACPSTHPRQMPMLELALRYPTTGGPAVRLASGAIDTAHADFMNGWDEAKLAALVRDCLNVDKYCGGSDAPVPGHN